MVNGDISYKVRESRRESGQVLEVLALAPSGRILGIVEMIVPLMPGYKLSERIGDEGQNSLIESAKAMARKIADAVEKPSVQQEPA